MGSLQEAGDALVAVVLLEGGDTTVLGSGVMIGPGLVIVATHVLDEFRARNAKPVLLTFLPDGTRAWLPRESSTVSGPSASGPDRRIVSDISLLSCTLNSDANEKHVLKGLYTVTGPTGRHFSPPPGRYWRISEEKLWELDKEGRIWWGPTGDARPSIKRYLNEVSDLVPRTIWTKESVGSTRGSMFLRWTLKGEPSCPPQAWQDKALPQRSPIPTGGRQASSGSIGVSCKQ
jgi:hypothetical protein